MISAYGTPVHCSDEELATVLASPAVHTAIGKDSSESHAIATPCARRRRRHPPGPALDAKFGLRVLS